MMLRRLAALAAAPVLALSLAAPALAADHDPVPRPVPNHVWYCVDDDDVSVNLLGILGLDIDLDLLHPWHGRYCGWVPFPYAG